MKEDTRDSQDKDPHGDVYAISRRVLEELAPGEVDVALGFLDPLIETSLAGELLTIDGGDVAGGFGGTDVLFAAIVPAVARTLTRVGPRLSDGETPGEALEANWIAAEREIEEVARGVGSKRALELLVELKRAIREATERHFTRA